MAKKKDSYQLTPLEMEIMNILWELGPASVQMVQQKLTAERELAYTTVQTMLNVLHGKGRVKRVLKERAYHYQATMTKSQAVRQVLGDLVDRLFGGSSENLVMSLVEEQQISPEKLNELAKVVNKAKKEQDKKDGKAQ